MLEPGIYHGLSMAEYLAMHAVSQGTLQKLLDECAKAAWFDSYLNPRRVIETSDAADIGSCAHMVLLEGHADGIAVIDPREHPGKTKPFNIPKGWTNDSIKQARDVAIAQGLIPLLPDDRDQVAAMVAEALEFIDSLRDTEPAVWSAFQPGLGKSEVTFVWDDDGVLCRCRTDRIANDLKLVTDYKSTEMSVEPDRWGRKQLVNQGYYFGGAFYRRVIKGITGVAPDYVWLAQEQKPPYLCSLIGCDPASLALGDSKVDAAIAQWRKCVEAGKWPGYPNRIAYPSMPAFVAAQWEEQQIEDGHVFV